MTRSRSLISLVGVFALAGLGPAFASASEGSDPSLGELRVQVVAPFRLAIRNRTWEGDPHAMPSGSAHSEGGSRAGDRRRKPSRRAAA